MSDAPSNGDLIRAAYQHWEESLGSDPEPFFALVSEEFAMASVLNPPDLPALKLKMKDFSRDPAWVAELLADPYTQDETQPVETVAALVRAGERMAKEFGTITLPVLIMHGTADKATRPDGSQEFFDHAGSPDKQLILYQDHYHDLLNDLGRERVMADVVGWLEARLPAGPMVTAPATGGASE